MRAHLQPRRLAWNLATIALLAAWFVLLAPTGLGGPASYVRVDGHSMDPTYATDDLIVLREQESYQKGDIIAFRVTGGQVIHRVVGGDGQTGYRTQGDNNPDLDPWRPPDADVLGEAWIRLPGAGRLMDLPRDPWAVGGITFVLTALALTLDELRKKRTPAEPAADAAAGVRS